MFGVCRALQGLEYAGPCTGLEYIWSLYGFELSFFGIWLWGLAPLDLLQYMHSVSVVSIPTVNPKLEGAGCHSLDAILRVQITKSYTSRTQRTYMEPIQDQRICMCGSWTLGNQKHGGGFM